TAASGACFAVRCFLTQWAPATALAAADGGQPANHREENMTRKTGLFGKRGRSGTPMAMAAFGCAALAAGVAPAPAADLTFERLVNPEPQNWLTNHHDYTSQRFSPLDAINKGNIRNLRLLFAIALGGTSTNESLEATPLVEVGFMYMVDSWGVVSKIDVRSGTAGRFLWKMDPKLEKQDPNRGVASWQHA